ncbi:nucleotide sugar dehydrogenase [Nevskia soli]|uniref:nucleotide sugar dehydrogenase n=1 Tax=Nevskia soli TaxID=418856 RepID=UPI0015D94172|nr:nucleotide sugar dehydrogenase [Nevskia soli]
MSATEARTIAVLGLGYVGCVSAACLARLGHRVVGVDRDRHKVQSVLDARAPFFEPGLEPVIQEGVAAGRLSATDSLAEAIGDADIALICVGTPSEANGNLGLGQLRRVAEEIGQLVIGRAKPLIVVVRSTVFPGTCEEVVIPAVRRTAGVEVVSNPEFLREGSAVKDFLEPSLLVVGGDDPGAVRRVADLYAALDVEPCLVSLRTAEMIKYACNCFHALKISFANEVGTLCDRLDIPANEVMETLCRDVKLNISPAYLKPGFSFGGSCLPKDLRALTYRASRLDLKLPMLESVLPANDQHLRRAMDAAMQLPASRIGIFGLAFKENTDDLRESPVVSLIEFLIGKGRDLRIYDPHIQLDEIYGANLQFILKAIPHIGRLLTRRFEEVLDWCDHLVVAQRPSAAIADQIADRGVPVLDVTSFGSALTRPATALQ